MEERDIPEPEPNWDKIKKDIKTQIDIFCYNIVIKNSLIITSIGVLYLKFANVCYTNYDKRIKEYIRYFAIIFQSTKLLKYTYKMIHIVAFFKKL